MPHRRRPRSTVIAASSRGGRLRQEDALGHWRLGRGDGPLLAVVADGLGGHGGGAEAARAVVGTAERLWLSEFPAGGCPASFLEQWLLEAHAAVLREAARLRCPAMAAVVAMVAQSDRVHWIHVGDCRLYQIRNGRTLHRTRDHSVVQELYEQGHIAEHEMGGHPRQHELCEAVGSDDPPTPTCGMTDLVPGDVFILCSDGLWENFHPVELERLAGGPPALRHRALQLAVAEAVRRSGQEADNTSALLVAFDPPPNPGVSLGGLLALTTIAACATVWALANRGSGGVERA